MRWSTLETARICGQKWSNNCFSWQVICLCFMDIKRTTNHFTGTLRASWMLRHAGAGDSASGGRRSQRLLGGLCLGLELQYRPIPPESDGQLLVGGGAMPVLQGSARGPWGWNHPAPPRQDFVGGRGDYQLPPSNDVRRLARSAPLRRKRMERWQEQLQKDWNSEKEPQEMGKQLVTLGLRQGGKGQGLRIRMEQTKRLSPRKGLKIRPRVRRVIV